MTGFEEVHIGPYIHYKHPSGWTFTADTHPDGDGDVEDVKRTIAAWTDWLEFLEAKDK